MRKITLIIIGFALFYTFYSCENQGDIIELNSSGTHVNIDKKSQIDNKPTSLSKEQIKIDCCGKEQIHILYAGQDIKTGTITISNNADYLYVTCDVSNNWWLSETHLFVGLEKDIPLSGGGNPKIGHFPYHGNHKLVQSYTFKIPLANLSDCFVISAHAVVVKKENNEIIASETAFGFGNNEFDGNRWGWYIDYCKTDCDIESNDDDGDDDTSEDDGEGDNDDEVNNEDAGNGNTDGTDNGTSEECLDAFAFGDSNQSDCFMDDGFMQWGWTSYMPNLNQLSYSKQYDLYINAEDCNRSKGKIIGIITVQVSGGDGRLTAKVDYVLTDKAYIIHEVNFNVGEEKYPINSLDMETISPSEYNFSKYDLNVESISFEITDWPINAYVIPYAKVCSIGSANNGN